MLVHVGGLLNRQELLPHGHIEALALKICPGRSCDFANKPVCGGGRHRLPQPWHPEAEPMSTGRAVGRCAPLAAGLVLAAAILVFLALPVEAQQAVGKEPTYRAFPAL